MTETTILDESAVSEIEAQSERCLSFLTFGEPTRGNRYVESVDADFYFEENTDAEFDAFVLLRHIPALCATVKHLRLDLNSTRESYQELEEEYSKRVTEIEQLRAENERAHTLFKNACRLHTDWMIDRYLMSNAVNRIDPGEKAQRHIELCKFYVAAVRGCSLEDAMSDFEQDFDRLHEESQELTSSLDTEIGFPLDQTPDYEDLNPKFFERFHAIACRVLGV